MNARRSLWLLLTAGLASTACMQANASDCVPPVEPNITYPSMPLKYPMASDQYAVQYQLGNGGWISAPVWISYYGGTMASPSNSSSGYVPGTSMSFVSIPAQANTQVQLLVTKLSSGFVAADNVSVRPSVKPVAVNVGSNGTVTLTTTTTANFAGEQFLLWWSDGTNGGTNEALAFFLDPPYPAPTGTNVKTITNYTDLTNLNHFDTLAFQGKVTLGGTGDIAYQINTNIMNVYLAPGSWVQGKLFFKYSGGVRKQIYGPGVLDGSLFNYGERSCPQDPGYHALAFDDTPDNSSADSYFVDGIVITDHNHATADLLVGGGVNNVKSIGWNGLNGGFRLGDNTSVSNVFLRSGDDSLMVWGTNITVTNATVWQNYNGGVVNLGWGNGSTGDYSLIDGLYVVKTDWHSPTHPSFTKTNLDGQNNAIIASLMVPGTQYGSTSPPLFRNIVVEDAPQVLFSLKILFPECDDSSGPREGNCVLTDLTQRSVMNVNVENLCSPASLVSNSVGFLTLPAGFSYEFPKGTTNTFTNKYPLTGSINIGLTNVILKLTNGAMAPLTSANAATTGMLMTSGTNAQVSYSFSQSECTACLPQLNIVEAAGKVVLSWPTNYPTFNLEMATNQTKPLVWKTNVTAPAIVGGSNVVTNAITGSWQLYRLTQ